MVKGNSILLDHLGGPNEITRVLIRQKLRATAEKVMREKKLLRSDSDAALLPLRQR